MTEFIILMIIAVAYTIGYLFGKASKNNRDKK
jgi:hypothetical protein